MNPDVQSAFPLFPKSDFDFVFSKTAWTVGLQSEYPDEVKRRIAGALVSVQMGLSSVDYTVKRYLARVQYDEGSADRLDKACARLCSSIYDQFASSLNATRTEISCGQFVAEWSLNRAGFSNELMTHCCHRGALFEAVAIGRTMLERLAFAYAAVELQEDERVFALQPQKCIGALRLSFPMGPALYGWLSEHTHWTVTAHRKSVVSVGDGMGHLFASSYFKLVSFSLALVLAAMHALCLPDIVAASGRSRDEFLPWARAKADETSALFSKILQIEKDDSDLLRLAQLHPTYR